MRDAGRHLPQARQAVLEPQLFFELHHLGEIAEEADDAMRFAAGVLTNRRDGEAEVRRRPARQRYRAPHDWPGRPQTLLEHIGERPGVLQHLSIGPFPAVARQAEHGLAGGIQGADDAIAIDDEESGGEAGDDLAAQALRGFGARLHRAFAVAELAHGLFHGRGHEGRLASGFPLVLGGGAGGREDAENGVGEHGRQGGDNRRQAEEEVAALGHAGGDSVPGCRFRVPGSRSPVLVEGAEHLRTCEP